METLSKLRSCPSASAGSGEGVRSIAPKADSTSVADSGLSAGSLAKSLMIKASRGFGQAPLCQEGATGGVFMC